MGMAGVMVRLRVFVAIAATSAFIALMRPFFFFVLLVHFFNPLILGYAITMPGFFYKPIV